MTIERITELVQSRSVRYPLIILFAAGVFLNIGIPLPIIKKDAAEYNAYALNLLAGRGYSLTGATFNDFREPGYPFFIAGIYAFFGERNVIAVTIIQTLLVAIMGILAYLIFVEIARPTAGLFAGLAIVLLPAYGLYAHNLTTEVLFATLVVVQAYLCANILRSRGAKPWFWFAALGGFAALTALVRVQFIFFIPFLILCSMPLVKALGWRQWIQNAAIALIVFMLCVGSWAFYVYQHTGHYAITSGRQEIVLHVRALRAELSYKALTQYAYEWAYRSISGGATSAFLMNNEFAKAGQDYNRLATTTEAIATIKKQDLNILLSNPGHYLYGNIIETMKLVWIEHDFGNFFGRFVRLGMYMLVYGVFFVGLLGLLRTHKDWRIASIAYTAIAFIAYNFIVLTPFDTIPRYNTPYLALYLIGGIAGLLLWRDRIRSTRRVSGQPQLLKAQKEQGQVSRLSEEEA